MEIKIFVPLAVVALSLLISTNMGQETSSTTMSSVSNTSDLTNSTDMFNSTDENGTLANSSDVASFRGYAYNAPPSSNNAYLPPDRAYLPSDNSYNSNYNGNQYPSSYPGSSNSNQGQSASGNQGFQNYDSDQGYNPNNQDYTSSNEQQPNQQQSYQQQPNQQQTYQQQPNQQQTYQQQPYQQQDSYQQQQQAYNRKRRAPTEKPLGKTGTMKPSTHLSGHQGKNSRSRRQADSSSTAPSTQTPLSTTGTSLSTTGTSPNTNGTSLNTTGTDNGSPIFIEYEVDFLIVPNNTTANSTTDSSDEFPDSTESDEDPDYPRDVHPSGVSKRDVQQQNQTGSNNTLPNGFFVFRTNVFRIDSIDVYYDDSSNETANTTDLLYDYGNSNSSEEQTYVLNGFVIIDTYLNNSNDSTTASTSTEDTISRFLRDVSGSNPPRNSSEITSTTYNGTQNFEAAEGNDTQGRSGFQSGPNQDYTSSGNDANNYFRFQDPDSYEYRYEVNDESTGDVKGAYQKLDNNVTVGSYHVLLPDGRHLYVNYTADANGYVAQVRFDDSNSTDSQVHVTQTKQDGN